MQLCREKLGLWSLNFTGFDWVKVSVSNLQKCSFNNIYHLLDVWNGKHHYGDMYIYKYMKPYCCLLIIAACGVLWSTILCKAALGLIQLTLFTLELCVCNVISLTYESDEDVCFITVWMFQHSKDRNHFCHLVIIIDFFFVGLFIVLIFDWTKTLSNKMHIREYDSVLSLYNIMTADIYEQKFHVF